MAETLTGMSIEHFFKLHVSYSNLASTLSFLLIGLLILFGTDHHRANLPERSCQKREPRFWSFGFVFSSLAMGIGGALATQRSLVRFMDQIGLRAHSTWAKVLIADVFDGYSWTGVSSLASSVRRSTELLGRHGTSPSPIDKLITWLIDKCRPGEMASDPPSVDPKIHRRSRPAHIICGRVVTTFADNFSQQYQLKP